jgi:hypothetical protein
MGAPWLVQAGARLVSQPPTPGTGPLSVMELTYTGAGAGKVIHATQL